MYLKKLEMQGFKSFPEYTVIDFDRGMTAVVGPNGSGKSNVTDAIRWVLGEQSVKSLRGGKMEDVIFNGTELRKAMNYSEVTITFDNVDRYFNFDFSEIQVTRRLYRSGESEYQINKVNCRLKDILELFLDTGLGRDGYSIVGQGKVDEILSVKSEDRRRVIEEAAGVVKYKVRKEEAERKLASTEQNLLRINDIFNELKDRIGPLEEQSSKAREYHKAYEELKTKEISLLVHRITEATSAIGDSADVKSQLELEIKEQEDRYLELRSSHQTELEVCDRLDEDIETQRQLLSELTEHEHELITEQKVASERCKQFVDRINDSASQSRDLASQKDALEEDLKNKISKADQLLKEADDARSKAEEFVAKRDCLYAEFEESQKSRKDLDSAVEAKTMELFKAKQKVTEAQAKIASIDTRINELSESRRNAIESEDRLKADLEKSDSVRHEFVTARSAVVKDIDLRSRKLEELQSKQVELNQFFDRINKQLSADDARLRTLKDLERRKEGYQESVRRLLAEAQDDRSVSGKIVGVLGDLINVDAKYQTAIEIALGSAIHNIVTETEEDASMLIDVLKQKHLGRITFLPIENIAGKQLDSKVACKAEQTAGYIGIAADLVECDDSIRSIVMNLLGRIIVSEDLDSARIIAGASGHSVKVITLAGDSVNPGGSLTGGSVKKSGVGILGRGREIESLTESVRQLEDRLADSEESRQEVDDSVGTLKRELAMLDEQLKFYQLEEVKAEGDYKNIESKLNELIDSVNSYEENIGAVSKEKIRLEEDVDELHTIETELEDELSDFKESLEAGDNKTREFNEKLESIRGSVNEFTSLSERKIAERNGVLELSRHIQGQIRNCDESIRSIESDANDIGKQIAEAKSEIENIGNGITEIKNEEAVYEAKIASLNEEHNAVSSKLSTFGDRLTSASDAINTLQGKLNGLVAKYDKYFAEIDMDKNKLWEDYEVTYDNVRADAVPVDKPAEQQKQIQTLKNSIKQLGPVNLNSIEEYRELSERLDFMTSQRDDIINAKTDLEKVIAELVDEMKDQFITHFGIINENFKQVFVDLFGGGTAEIILENDDVLNCAIEIKAQPPGKKLQSLLLLSGGERCLTAIALLFAILELKPSPFVILDEVDAALDDVNISCFTDFVRRHCAKSQFIVVTHRKGTMEACDQMYGVTMAERGISKILSMELR